MNKSNKTQVVASSKSKGKKRAKSQKTRKPRDERSVAPLANTRLMRTGVPQVSGSPYSSDGRVRIRHREYIQDVSGSVNFSSQSLPINPGISSVFPWLSVMAKQFESFLFRRLRFDFETQKSASTSGSVMLAVDFDAADSPPSSKQELMSYHNAVRSAVWSECSYSSDEKDLQKFGIQRYIRTGSLGPNLDIKTYDVGKLVVATQGEADTSVIGELYVEYDVELITPQLSFVVEPTASGTFSFSDAVPTNADLFASAVPDPLNMSSVSYAANVFTFAAAGQYVLSYYLAGDAPPTPGPPTLSVGSTLITRQDSANGINDLAQIMQVSMLAGGTVTLTDVIGTGVGGFMIITLLPDGWGNIVA